MNLLHESRRFLWAVSLASALLLVSEHASAESGERLLHSFYGHNDGALPSGGLVADRTGNFYGSTAEGGGGTGCYVHKGCGAVFEIAKDGGETVLHAFQGGSDGIEPVGSLLIDGSGNVFGATQGGAGSGCAGYGCGAIFMLAPDGTENILYAFQGGSDGQYPQGNLIADKSGNLYGVTSQGGSYDGPCTEFGCGTVFEIEPNGAKNILYEFQGGTDGSSPFGGGVIADKSSNLYGTTSSGGTCPYNSEGCGTVFKLGADGAETVLYAFQDGGDGGYPEAGLIMDSAGNLYGTTSAGGTIGWGTVFKIAPNGQETVLYSFKAGSDGSHPVAGLVMDKGSNLYGATYAGGGTGCKKTEFKSCGTVFELSSKGAETALLKFDRTDGSLPASGLFLGSHGKLYGVATEGGKYDNGVVFEVEK